MPRATIEFNAPIVALESLMNLGSDAHVIVKGDGCNTISVLIVRFRFIVEKSKFKLQIAIIAVAMVKIFNDEIRLLNMNLCE